MNLYLVQHAKARPKEEDPSRPLSDRGRSELLKVMSFLDTSRKINVETIFHSGKERAEQTATLLAAAIQPTIGVEKSEGLSPMDDPAIWAEKLKSINSEVMLVGHLPHMGRLASLLLCGDAELQPVHIHNAGIICLRRNPDNHWAVDWIIIPELLCGQQENA